MIRKIPCSIAPEDFCAMEEKVLKMNTGIEDFIHNEMLNHRKAYSAGSGLRITEYVPMESNWYTNNVYISYDGALINCECILPPGTADSDILYIHGAAFQRRVNDINLKTADRLCLFTHAKVWVPDYRVGVDYTYDQMVGDIVACYEEILRSRSNDARHIALLADSSGCVSAMQALSQISRRGLPGPSRVVLWSPQADGGMTEERIAAAKVKDISIRNNNVFNMGAAVYSEQMCKGKTPKEIFPIYGDFACLKDSQVLIQVGAEEILYPDAIQMFSVLDAICPCKLEVFEKMFHNFQTYYSICEMSKTAWANAVEFIIKDKE